MTSGHLMTSDVDDFSEASVDKGLQLVVVLHVSEPYSRRDLTLVLKILIVHKFQNLMREINATYYAIKKSVERTGTTPLEHQVQKS